MSIIKKERKKHNHIVLLAKTYKKEYYKQMLEAQTK